MLSFFDRNGEAPSGCLQQGRRLRGWDRAALALPDNATARLVMDREHVLERVARTLHRPPGTIAIVKIYRSRHTECVCEIECDPPLASPANSRCVAKFFKDRRGGNIAGMNRRLWNAGFCPPHPFTVAQTLAYSDVERVLIQEKAPGASLWSFLFRPAAAERPAPMQDVARWLLQLQSSTLPQATEDATLPQTIATQADDLIRCRQTMGNRIEACAAAMIDRLRQTDRGSLVLSHGDFHAKNIYVSSDRITVIDLETVGLREREADIGYFLGQISGMGNLELGSFHATDSVRKSFLDACRQSDPRLSGKRIALYIAIWFLQNLHYRLCALQDKRDEIAPVWVSNAERCLDRDEVSAFKEIG